MMLVICCYCYYADLFVIIGNEQLTMTIEVREFHVLVFGFRESSHVCVCLSIQIWAGDVLCTREDWNENGET